MTPLTVISLVIFRKKSTNILDNAFLGADIGAVFKNVLGEIDLWDWGFFVNLRDGTLQLSLVQRFAHDDGFVFVGDEENEQTVDVVS